MQQRFAPVLLRPVLAVLLIAGAIVVAIRQPSEVAQTSSLSTTTTVESGNCWHNPSFSTLNGLSLSRVREIARQQKFLLSVLRVPSTSPVGTVVDWDWTALQGWCYPTMKPTVPVGVSTGPLKNRRGILVLATLPPTRDECTQSVGFGEDGTVGPPVCSNGAVNVDAWMYSALWFSNDGFGAFVRLGPHVSEQQVIKVFNEGQPTIPIGTANYLLAQAYYGWPTWPKFPECVQLQFKCPTPPRA